jgi:hypothetical protein
MLHKAEEWKVISHAPKITSMAHPHTGATTPATVWMGVAVAFFSRMQYSSQFKANGNTEHEED